MSPPSPPICLVSGEYLVLLCNGHLQRSSCHAVQLPRPDITRGGQIIIPVYRPTVIICCSCNRHGNHLTHSSIETVGCYADNEWLCWAAHNMFWSAQSYYHIPAEQPAGRRLDNSFLQFASQKLYWGYNNLNRRAREIYRIRILQFNEPVLNPVESHCFVVYCN